MSTPVIRVENLGKRYLIRHQEGRKGAYQYLTLREEIARRAERLFSRKGRTPASAKGAATEEFWALRDVSFDVNQGDAIAIIGKNGAGKSTLLKILSRITEPTAGRASIRGRIASLLEVGTGFHPELTGRENIFLNGAILGMSRNEIQRRFDEIVAFAEVEKFLDTPVKRYSSGMYVRLAFAVAAHLEPEILIVDEVLAVGDLKFQRKCLQKMDDVAAEGRTIFFVSHNMEAISQLTRRAILLESGRVRMTGSTAEVISGYLSSGKDTPPDFRAESTASHPFLAHARIETSDPGGIHRFGEPLRFHFEIGNPARDRDLRLSFQICDERLRPIVHLWTAEEEFADEPPPTAWRLTCEIPRPRLYMGRYTLTVYLAQPPGGEFYERREGLCPFEVSMVDVPREYQWRPGDCVYLEVAKWVKNQQAN